ncbi:MULTISPECIES: Sec-independent protein translocase protein TatB [Methylococcus]|uniref:Sec-independent protein translocase protein TatB n=1 Tax=Methylococcus capsulatus TaxID=414 RepID=A0ABZ2F546_METCP|nr:MULTISPECIES: Sec-independent protein translocase protein TatB [Methylococcus]MDF9391577.1 twin-arginine translocase subunit TatB [Methylococcus capsulatus]
MFDIGFTEMLLIGLVALLAFGPERLPKVARETGYWIRKARSTLASVRAEIEHEMEMQELKQAMQEAKSGRLLESAAEKGGNSPEHVQPENESGAAATEQADDRP